VLTDENPADLLTSGISAQQSSQLWLHGPSWLTRRDQWPTWSPAEVVHLQNIYVENEIDTRDHTNPAETCGIHIVIDATRYSRLGKLLAIIVYIHRFCHNLKHSDVKITGPDTAKELSDATMLWIKDSQQMEYYEKITNLTTKSYKCTLLVCQL